MATRTWTRTRVNAATTTTVKRANELDDDRKSASDDDSDDAFEREVMAEMTEVATEEDDDDERAAKRRRESAGAAAAETERAVGAFGQLPEDVTSLVLRLLAPNELCALGQTCKHFKAQCDRDFLWRQCFIERFGNVKQARQAGMKKLYFLYDALEIDRERRKAPAVFEKIFVEAFAAKRSQVCANIAPLCEQVATDQVAREWKSHRKFSHDATHVCSRRNGCSYQELQGKVFVCERTGKVHVCDDTCRERQLDEDSGTEICQISGASFDTVLPDEDDEDEQTVAEQEQQYFEKGYFGRAFEVGYGCDNELELQTALWGGPTRGGN